MFFIYVCVYIYNTYMCMHIHIYTPILLLSLEKEGNSAICNNTVEHT